MEFGLNLYSVRKNISTEPDFLKTAIALKDMGYSFLQFSGATYDVDMITRVSNESRMPIVLTHVPLDRIVDDTDALMEEHARFGCKNIGLGHMSPDIVEDEKLCKETIAKMNLAAEKMQKNGFSFFYHNHQFEFHRYGEQTVLDYMAENAPYINFTLDTYWLQYGGVSVIEYVEKLKGRIDCVHLKDYLIDIHKNDEGKRKLAPRFSPVGDGVMNFKTIIPKMLKSGTKYFIVEQDNAPDFDALEQVKRSIDYLKKEF